MLSFNLLNEPWLPVRGRDGSSDLVGLRACLTSPSHYVGLDTTQPTEALALYRLLLAICHRALGAGSSDDRARLLAAWPIEQIDHYLTHWAERFDLFGDAPFLQIKALGSANLQPSPWTRLAFDRASGNARVLFDHSVDATVAPIAPAVAARLLVAHLQFTPGGLVRAFRDSATRGPACGVLCVMALGEHLAETLALNLVSQAAREFADDAPPWELAAPDMTLLRQGAEVVPAGPVQRFTHLSRAVLLRPEADGSVSRVLYAEGLDLSAVPRLDPMAAGRRVEGEVRPILVHGERALWRDLQSLVVDGVSLSPACVESATVARMQLGDFRPLDLLAGGLLTDKAKLVLWRLEERRLSPLLLTDTSGIAARIRPALELAEAAGTKLQAALWSLAKHWLSGTGARDVARADVSALLDQLTCMPRYWTSLEPDFWKFIDRLSAGEDPDAAFKLWAQDVESALRAAWTGATTQLGAGGRALRAASLAGAGFARALATTQLDPVEA